MSRIIILSLLIFVISSTRASESNDNFSAVTTKCGQLRGKVLDTSKGKCEAFLGLPFASPPVGKLRFEKPQPAACWTGVRDATEFGAVCIQDSSTGLGHTGPGNWTESEDCLYLNVFVPGRVDPKERKPVLVFIHGGAFSVGSARKYGDVGICENLASRGVIVVTVQYRLFLYGFFSTGDQSAKGNYAIWDQIASLKWIQENIAQFGGDPGKVTIYGESAGSASVSLLTYIPAAKDLFHRSIAGSGSALSSWATPRELPVETSMLLAKAANCTNNTKNLVDCLRQLSTAEMQKIYNSFNLSKTNLYAPMSWSVRVDGELFKKEQLQELKPPKAAIIGVNSREQPAEEDLMSKAESMINETLQDVFPGDNLKSNILKQAARYVYIDSKGDRNDKKLLCQQLAEIVSDVKFRAPAALEAESKTIAGESVWVYKFDHYSNNTFPVNYPFLKGAAHAHELCYVFLTPSIGTCPEKFEGDDRIVADHLGEMWTNFVIHGDPSPSSLQWPKFRNVTNAGTMHIRRNLTILPEFYLEISNFWNYFVPNIKRDFDSDKQNGRQ